MRGRDAIALVARREITERIREKSFLVSTALNIVIIVAVVIVIAIIGGGDTRYVVGYTGETEAAVVESAAASARGVDIEIEAREVDRRAGERRARGRLAGRRGHRRRGPLGRRAGRRPARAPAVRQPRGPRR